MKNILAIIGSPRKGETYKAVSKFEEELNKLESVQVEYIMLGKYGISECTGCHNCIKKGEAFCHEHQRISELLNKMINADGVILATPVYNQQVTALMKKFMDYNTYLWHRPALFGIKFLGISSGGGMFKPVFKYLKMNVENWGGIWVDGLGVPHYESLTEKYKQKSNQDFSRKAKSFLEVLKIKTLPKPSMGRLLWFNMWKMNAEAAKEDIVKDYTHWTKTNWFAMDYYYTIKVRTIKKIAINAIMKLMRSFMRKVYKGY